MTVTAAEQTVSITRCGLCKIDRKGRFILASPEAQRIFGLTEVELFGRPFIDFIQTSDRPTYQQLIKNRSPYDTGYDSAGVTLIGADGQAHQVTLVVSINFGGGNPANYQIVIRPDDRPAAGVPDEKTSDWEALLLALTTDFERSDPKRLVDLLKSVSEAATVSIYDLSEEQHGCVASTDNTTVSLTFLDQELHQAGESGAPPNEVRATYDNGAGRTALVRFAFDTNGEAETANRVRQRCEQAASLVHALRPPIANEKPEPAPPPTSPAQVLDQLKIGFVAFHRNGTVAQHNATFETWFGATGEIVSVKRLVDLVGSVCGDAAASALDGYLAVLSGCDCLPGFKATYDTFDGRSLCLEIVPLEPSTEQATHCFLFYESGGVFARPTGARGVSSQVGTTAIELLKSTMDATVSVWQKLEHEHHDRLSRDGGFYLGCLSHHLETMADTIRDFEWMLRLIGDEEEAQIVDLDLLVGRVTDSILQSYPGARLTVRHSDLPKVTVPLKKLTAVLHDVLILPMPAEGDRAVEVTVTASVEQGSCTIWIRDNGSGLTSRQKKTLSKLRRSFSKDKTGKPGGLCVGVAVAREILASINGTLELDSRPGKGSIVKIVFPSPSAS